MRWGEVQGEAGNQHNIHYTPHQSNIQAWLPCITQQAPCSTQHATRNTQHATRSTQHAAHSTHTQHAARSMNSCKSSITLSIPTPTKFWYIYSPLPSLFSLSSPSPLPLPSLPLPLPLPSLFFLEMASPNVEIELLEIYLKQYDKRDEYKRLDGADAKVWGGGKRGGKRGRRRGGEEKRREEWREGRRGNRGVGVSNVLFNNRYYVI